MENSPVNPFASPNAPIVTAPANRSNIEGIGGWLILVLLGLAITPISIVFQLLTMYLPVFNNGVWQALNDPASQTYNPTLAKLIVFECVCNLLIMGLSILALVLMFTKSRHFPRMMIGFYAVNLAFVGLDLYLAQHVQIAENDGDGFRTLIRTVIAAAIWIPYMLVSKRVKATFVR